MSGRKGNKAFDYASNHRHTLAEWMGGCSGLLIDVVVDVTPISKRARQAKRDYLFLICDMM